MNDKQFLQQAIEKARESVSQGGFPAGAVIVKNGKVVGEGVSVGNRLNDPTSHGETAAIRDACKKLETSDLSGSVLYASMEPCIMCFGATMWSAVSKVVFALSKDKISPEYYGGHYETSALNSELTTPVEITHVSELENESLEIVKEWEKTL